MHATIAKVRRDDCDDAPLYSMTTTACSRATHRSDADERKSRERCGGVYLLCGYDDDGWCTHGGMETRADGRGHGRDGDRSSPGSVLNLSGYRMDDALKGGVKRRR